MEGTEERNGWKERTEGTGGRNGWKEGTCPLARILQSIGRSCSVPNDAVEGCVPDNGRHKTGGCGDELLVTAVMVDIVTQRMVVMAKVVW